MFEERPILRFSRASVSWTKAAGLTAKAGALFGCAVRVAPPRLCIRLFYPIVIVEQPAAQRAFSAGNAASCTANCTRIKAARTLGKSLKHRSSVALEALARWFSFADASNPGPEMTGDFVYSLFFGERDSNTGGTA